LIVVMVGILRLALHHRNNATMRPPIGDCKSQHRDRGAASCRGRLARRLHSHAQRTRTTLQRSHCTAPCPQASTCPWFARRIGLL